ncbi:N-formylglutamate deformylase [uncultured Roseobacter sp.]|uniref:N-formylglutamate deformylase n=1 Tax=uncultured Roseobacter sp. TaxID=114847 RepID=UPI00262FB638|nr:N-formylglutamate deformylase [uncultured Roseobacter sp.]
MPVEMISGDSPLIMCLPHTGTDIPPLYWKRLNDNGQMLRDTDWHLDRLCKGLAPQATVVRARFSRYLSDVNRDPDGQPPYPDKLNSNLIPYADQDGVPIWDTPPMLREISALRAAFFVPYHAALQGQIARVQSRFGHAVICDCHSVRSRIPHRSDGQMPDLNIGTRGGTACDQRLSARVAAICQTTSQYTTAFDGRFQGEWVTRRYGRPARGVHLIQIEIAQDNYLAEEAEPWEYDEVKAEPLREVLRSVLNEMSDWYPDKY